MTYSKAGTDTRPLETMSWTGFFRIIARARPRIAII